MEHIPEGGLEAGFIVVGLILVGGLYFAHSVCRNMRLKGYSRSSRVATGAGIGAGSAGLGLLAGMAAMAAYAGLTMGAAVAVIGGAPVVAAIVVVGAIVGGIIGWFS